MSLQDKNIIIVEGSDSTGKSKLCEYLREYVGGKCHTLHSNYCLALPKENHYRQHKLIAKFVNRQFSSCYTGNRLVILDRNYISDIVYGAIGYGSKGNFDFKLKVLDKLFKIISHKLNDVTVTVIYCNPSTRNFNESSREELLNDSQEMRVRILYDKFFSDVKVKHTFCQNNVKVITYDFMKDPEYTGLIAQLD